MNITLYQWLHRIEAKQDQILQLLKNEGRQMKTIFDQLSDLHNSDVAEHQAILDAAKRVDDKLATLTAANPALADEIAGIQADTAALANIAAAAPPPAPAA